VDASFPYYFHLFTITNMNGFKEKKEKVEDESQLEFSDCM